jgi:hypothetical protein
MRKDPDFFGEEELALIYIAKRLKEALALEERLTERGLDYLVEPDTYTGGVIFRGSRVGAFFYVRPGDRDRSRHVLSEHGYQPYEPFEGEAKRASSSTTGA